MHRTITLQPLTILLPLVVGIKIYTYIFYFISFKLSGVGIKKYKLNSCDPKFIFLSSRNFKQTGHVVSSRRPLRHLGGARGLMGSCSVFTLKSPCLFRPKRDNQSWMGNERPSTGSFWLLTEYKSKSLVLFSRQTNKRPSKRSITDKQQRVNSNESEAHSTIKIRHWKMHCLAFRLKNRHARPH